MKKWKVIVLITLFTVTTGCAINNRTFGTRNTAFDDGQKLIAQGQFEKRVGKTGASSTRRT
jgi:general secretion pathway protein D